MARTAIPYSTLAPNSSIADPTPTTADPTNHHTIAAARPELTMLRAYNSGGASKNVIVKAGTYPPALAAGQGDLTVAVGAGAIVWLGPFESGRFLQSDGSMSVNLEAAFAGSLTAFKMPRNT